MRVLLVLALVACGKSSEPGSGSAGSAAAKTPRDAVVAAWTAAKLAPQLAVAQASVGKDCQAGTIEQLDVLICNFATPAEAQAAEAAGNAWVGAATGAAQAHGAALIVIADRKKADPSGRTINRLMKLAPGEPVR